MLVDIHAHLDHFRFKNDLDEVIERAKKEGVVAIITNGVNPHSNRQALLLSEKYDIVKPALGIYPLDALDREPDEEEDTYFHKPFDVDEELNFIFSQRKKITALGELGMDFKNGKDYDLQADLLKRFIQLSRQTDKPLIIHSRKAEKEVLDILESEKFKNCVLHCFCGKKNLIKRASDMGLYLTIPTNVTRLQHFQMLAEMVNISQLLTETDAPFLSPFAGERNEPKNIIETIKVLAEIKKMDVTEVKNNIFMNYQRIFG